MLRRIWNSRGLWLRVLFCWLLACAFSFFDEANHFDLRFSLRGAQEVNDRVVLVHFDEADWKAWVGASPNLLRSIKESPEINDSWFWRSRVWNDLLSQILAQDPASVGVTFFFNRQLPAPDENFRHLRDDRVIWAAQMDASDQPSFPLLADSHGRNVALVDLHEDEDQILRRFVSPPGSIPHMAPKLAEPYGSLPPSDSWLINFRGPSTTFPSISALNVLRGRAPPSFFKDRIVIVDSRSLGGYHTPVGVLSRGESLAQVTDNLLSRRWIVRLPFWVTAIYLLLILVSAVSVLTSYPQMVASVFLAWLSLGTAAFSIWIFDSFYIWLPAISSLLTVLVAYVVFIGYQLSLKENQTWRLEQETRLLSELDQLRNNFVSLISHDLKTPIAKIQAICDRLLSASQDEDVREGLNSVRKESVELHRYIQSILQISRLESNKVQIRKEPVDVNEVVERVVAQVRPLAADKRQDLNVELEPMFSIEADGVLIQEVVLNLLENAVKYTPNDGHIEVKTHEVDDKVVFSVADSGPGIPEKDQRRIFQKFFRGKAQESGVKGTGLGLFLVKYFIELHGGEVFLESEIGKGTRVGFTLPVQA